MFPRIDGVVDRRRYLPQRASGLRVVHLGCVDEHLTRIRAGTGDLLHEELMAVAKELVGVDISKQGLADLSALVPGRYVQGDVEELSSLGLPEQCDLVVAAELIEHVANPGRFLTELRRYLAATGATALITTPNAYSWTHFVTFALRRREMTHPDHLCLYSPTTLVRALEGAGLEAKALYAHAWQGRAGARRLLSVLDAAVYRWNPLLAVGLVVEVRVGRV